MNEKSEWMTGWINKWINQIIGWKFECMKGWKYYSMNEKCKI